MVGWPVGRFIDEPTRERADACTHPTADEMPPEIGPVFATRDTKCGNRRGALRRRVLPGYDRTLANAKIRIAPASGIERRRARVAPPIEYQLVDQLDGSMTHQTQI